MGKVLPKDGKFHLSQVILSFLDSLEMPGPSSPDGISQLTKKLWQVFSNRK